MTNPASNLLVNADQIVVPEIQTLSMKQNKRYRKRIYSQKLTVRYRECYLHQQFHWVRTDSC